MMIVLAKISSFIGFALLFLGLCGAIAALLALPLKKLIALGYPASATVPARTSTNLNDAGVGLSLLGWPIFAVFTVVAVFGEMFTLFANAGFGYFYITLGMPSFMVAWLGLVVYASIRSVPTSWLFGALGAAVLIIFGYANIN